MKGNDLPADDHVVRYVKPSMILEDGVVDGSDFRVCAVRQDEAGLSVNWLEAFPGKKEHRLNEVRRLFRLRVRPNGRFAELNVDTILRVVSEELDTLRIVHDPLEAEDGFEADPSHAPTSIPKCNTGHLRREGGARAAQMAGRRGLRLSGNGGSGPGTAAVPSGRRISGLSGQRKAAAGAGRVRPGAGRAQPDRSPDGRDGLIRSTPSRRGHPRCREAGRRCQGGRARRNTSAGVR